MKTNVINECLISFLFETKNSKYNKPVMFLLIIYIVDWDEAK